VTSPVGTPLLVVDDDAAIRKLLQRIAVRAGFSVDTAADGLQALDMIRSKNYDIAIIDLMMPRLSGYDLVQKIGEMKQRPCLIVASAATDANMQSLDDSLVRTIIRKPFDIEAVAKALVETAEHIRGQQTPGPTIPIATPPGVKIEVSEECAPPDATEDHGGDKKSV
jgi:two-component system nitrogen regulation response regulator GlnG